MRPLGHLCTFLLVLLAGTLCLWTKTPVRIGIVFLMSTLSTKGIEGMDWPVPSPDVNPIEHVWDIRRITAWPAQPHKHYRGGPRTRAHLGVDKNSLSCNQETDSQLQFYV